MILSVFLIVLGIALLYFGGEALVENAKTMARQLGVSPLVVGLTVVAFATSCPELAATITASLRGSPDMALGNAIGSNIANIALILGVSALIAPLTASGRFLRREVAFMMLVTVLLYPLLADGRLGRIDGLLLVGGLIFFLVTLIRDPGSAQIYAEEDDDGRRGGVWPLFGVLLGIGLLVGGAQALVVGASDIARGLGVPDRVIGLTLLALGTSLPELATSLVAARKGESDIILGNVIGSNIFNLLCILGVTALIVPLDVARGALTLDYWMMFGTSALIIVLLALHRGVRALEGAFLLSVYVGYTIYLFL